MASPTEPVRGRERLSWGWREEWRQIVGNRSLLSMLLFLPLLYSVTVYWLYRSESVVDCPVIIVDQDGSSQSRRLGWLIDATPEARVVGETTSTEEAFAALRRHQAAAVVFVPEGFGKRLFRDEQAKLKLWIDSANMLTYGTAYTGIRNAVSVLDDERTRSVLVAKGLPGKQAAGRTTPIEVTERLLYHPTGSYGAFMAPAVFVVALQQAILLAFAVSAGNHRVAAQQYRSVRRPSYRRLLGRLLAHLPFHALSVLALVWLMRRLYPFPVDAGVGLLVLLAVFAVTTGLLGIVVSLPFTNGRAPLQVLVLVSTPLFLASGYTWPLDAMPEWVQIAARSVPSTPALDGLRTLGMKTANVMAGAPALAWMGLQALGYAISGWLLVTLFRRRGQAVHCDLDGASRTE